MKKLLLIILVFIPLISQAEVVKFKAYQLSYREYNANSSTWRDWSDWIDCNVLITMDIDKDVINIYSSEEQEFDVIEASDEYTDNKGGKNTDWTCVDKDGVKCTLCLRVQTDGTIQLYCRYSNIQYVYSIEVR